MKRDWLINMLHGTISHTASQSASFAFFNNLQLLALLSDLIRPLERLLFLLICRTLWGKPILVVIIESVKDCHQVFVLSLIWVHGVNLKVKILSKLLLQEACCSTNFKLAFGHNSDSIGQVLCLIHVVGGQDNYSVLLSLFNQLPCFSAGRGIHSWSRLIQKDDLGIA